MNHINIIQVDENFCEVEMITFRQILDLIQSIDNRKYNKNTNRLQIPIDAKISLIENIKSLETTVTESIQPKSTVKTGNVQIFKKIHRLTKNYVSNKMAPTTSFLSRLTSVPLRLSVNMVVRSLTGIQKNGN